MSWVLQVLEPKTSILVNEKSLLKHLHRSFLFQLKALFRSAKCLSRVSWNWSWSIGLLPEKHFVKVWRLSLRLRISIAWVVFTRYIAGYRGICISLLVFVVFKVVPMDLSGTLKLCLGALFWIHHEDWLLLLTPSVNFTHMCPLFFLCAGLEFCFFELWSTCRQLAEVASPTCLQQGPGFEAGLREPCGPVLDLPIAPPEAFLDGQRLNPQESIVHYFSFLGPCGLPKTWLHTFLRPH